MKRFDGRVAAVTGAARGIGLATATMFCREGGTLAIIDVNVAQASEAAGRIAAETGAKTFAIGADIGDIDAVRRAHAAIVERVGAPDIFINCAAVVDDKLFLDSAPADWHRVLSVGLYGALNCLHVFLPGMVKRGRGRMVFLASDSARIGQARLSYYAAAKGGMIALVKSVAQEVGRSGVTLNVVSPGAIDTDLRKARENAMLEQMGPEKYERRQKAVLKMYPLGRIGQPDEIATAVLFLASDEAAWVTGQVLSVNGGFCMV